MLTASLLVAGGALLLWVGAEALVRGAAALGARAGIPPVVIGLTVVSIGTSAPELVVCVLAAVRGSPDLAVGNVVGSNLANVGLILGLAAAVRPLAIAGQVVRREIPWMVALTVLLLPVLWNLQLGRVEGAVLGSFLFLYLFLLMLAVRSEKAGRSGSDVAAVALETGERVRPGGSWGRPDGLRVYAIPAVLVLAGSVGLVLGGQGIVAGATTLAASLGVQEMVIGLSVVAVGTSLPELATTVVAAIRREADLAVGNIVGSNIFNLTFVLGGTALVQPLTISPSVLRVEYPALVVVSLALLPLAWTSRNLGRLEGLFLLSLYAGAWGWILWGGT